MSQKENPLDYMFLEEEPINIREQIEKYAIHWKWFVLGVLITLAGAYTYLRYTPNLYEVSTTILIDDENNGGLISDLTALEGLGMTGGSNTLVENEIGILKSRTLVESVVKDLDLNIAYLEEGRVRTSELFRSSPIKVNFFLKDSLFFRLDTTFRVQVKSLTKFTLINAEGTTSTEHEFGENIIADFGDFTITPNTTDTKSLLKEIIVQISPVENVTQSYRNGLAIDFLMKGSDILVISLKDRITLKAELILNTLTSNYNKDAIENKSQIAINTNEFIKDRLLVIEKDLSDADSGVQEFKTTNSLTDISSEAALILDANSEIEKRIIDIKTQLQLAAYVTEYLENNTEDIIPANLGLGSGSGFNQNSQKYNELVLERNRISKSSKAMNPIIINLNNQIAELRKGVHQSLTNLKKSLSISLSIAQKEDARLNARITEVPRQEREFKDILRRQKIIESLYLFLLEKREENAISLAATIPSGKIIDTAIGNNLPVSPKRKIVYLAALIVGFLIPFVILYIRDLLDNKVHTSKELEAELKAPFLGDIPKVVGDKNVVISGSDRSSVSESFRLLRTNINFILSNIEATSKTIYVTSTIPSEGKTFVAINLAAAMALSNKKVLLIGADIRKPKIAEYLAIKQNKGLTHYLTTPGIAVQEVIEHVEAHNFDMIQSGISPPNPTELLMNGRFEEILDYGKQNYDYVIVDTAPVSVVADTLLFNQKADMFLYVVRAHFLDKRLLEIPKRLYAEKRLQNMAVIMNGSDLKKGYGYGYGYGYGQDEEKKKWWKF